MFRIIVRVLLLLAFWSLAPMAATARDGSLPSYDDLKVGDEVGTSIRVGTKRVTIPEGTWRLGFRSEWPVNSDGTNTLGTMVRLFLHEVIEGRLVRTLQIFVNSSSSNVSWNDLPCKTKDDAYWSHDAGYGLNNQFCTRVSFVSNVVDVVVGAEFEAWARSVKSQGISYSREMPFVIVTRYSRSDFLQMRVAFDPASSGIENSAQPQRHINDWQPDLLKPGSKRELFYKSLVDWAPQFSAAVDRVFTQDSKMQPAHFGRPSFPKAGQP